MAIKDKDRRREYLRRYFEDRASDKSPRACRRCGIEKPVDQFAMLPSNPGLYCIDCWAKKTREYNKKHRSKDPIHCAERDRRSHLLRTFGLTHDDYFNMLKAQSECCAICGEFQADNMCVDHDHATGRVRGLLCGQCNCGIGHMRDSASLLRAAIEYLEQSDHKTTQ